MRNRYEFVDGQTVKIWLQVRKSDDVRLFTYISPEDLEITSAVDTTWYGHTFKRRGTYVEGKIRNADGTRINVFLHRVLLGLKHEDSNFVDHINMDPLDNRRNNLRICTAQDNNQNVHRRYDNKSGFRGVVWRPKKRRWEAYCQYNGRPKHLGMYDNVDEAARVVSEFRQQNMPFSSIDQRSANGS